MTASTPPSESSTARGMSRRAAIAGGASAAAAALLASTSAEAHELGLAGEPDSWAIAAELTDHVSATAVDVRPLGTDNNVRVNLPSGGDANPPDLQDGSDVAVVLPPWSGQVEQSDVGSDGPVDGTKLIELIVGDPSDAPALQG
jgi:hypothetical protein